VEVEALEVEALEVEAFVVEVGAELTPSEAFVFFAELSELSEE
jgi:hypothetical protein